MKHRIAVLILFSLTSLSLFAQEKKKVLLTNKDVLSIRDGADYLENAWKISAEARPDVFTTTVKKKKRVVFYSDIDSISFMVEPGKLYNFVVLYQSKDSCFTQIKVIKDIPTAQFTSTYIQSHKGKYSIEVPEVHELVHTIMALAPVGIRDSNLVDHETDYYQEVMKTFAPYKNHPAVKKVNDLMAAGRYGHLKMDACGYRYDASGLKLLKDPIYNRMNWSNENFMESLVKDLEDFSRKSKFRTFFASHKNYYRQLITTMEQQTPIRKQWDWLEKRFPNKYDNYRITFSPLVNGYHCTNNFESNNFKQTIMYICGPLVNSPLPEKVKEGYMTRVVFTEIDHNYVNPISEKNIEAISKALADTDKWATKNAQSGYPNAFAIFNEYMTWAVFSAYAKDEYDAATFEQVNKRVEVQMSEWRGFPKFAAFNQEFLKQYSSRAKNESIADLYEKMLVWCEKQ